MTGNGWETTKLEKVLRLDLDSVPVEAGVTYPMVGVYSFGRGLFDREPADGTSSSYRIFYRLRPDHFVMSQLFGWEGALALSSEQFAGKFVSPQFPTFQCDPDRLSRYFLAWYTRQPHFWHELSKRARGMGDRRRTLNPDALFDCEITLPPRDEQDRIVARLDALAAKIEEAKRLQSSITEEVHSMVMSLHHHASADRSVEVGSLLTLHENREPTEPTKEYPQVGIRSFGGGLFAKPAVLGLGTTYKHFNRLEKGMVVLSQVKGWEGAIAVCPAELEGYYASPEYRTFRCVGGQCHSEYMKHLVRTPWFHEHLATATRGQGARRERTRPEMFLPLRIPMPTYQQQGEVVRLLDRLEAIPPHGAEIETEFNAMLPSILDKAFKREL